ncbi:hypothetical protein PAXINDRAFT_14844 [Paxillus involutus ATCC 200175]|uniref:Uncharacterized protein n=1 Tax=Paxillus involutus ATCC 200175 TaxID=664439 RepID=A0A0C9TYJ4_PAXIN|nr:hypothetical protein PAXINDRAFT_14844 [Paxillus involutus ATCC 200175]
MGRPKLYHTADDVLHAKRSYSQTYYAKNRKSISEKNKQRYRTEKRLKGAGKAGSLSVTSSGSVPQNQRRTRKHGQDGAVKDLERTLMIVVQQSLTRFLDHSIHNIIWSPSLCDAIKQLQVALQKVEEVRSTVGSLHASVLQANGVGSELQVVEVTSCRVTNIIHALEEVIIHGVADLENLMNTYSRGKLLYQCTPDIIPIM